MDAEINNETGMVSAETRIRQSGNSRVVTLSPLILQAAGIDRPETVELTAEDGGIVLKRTARAD